VPFAPEPDDDEEDDLEGLLEDAPDDLEDEDELILWFATRLGITDDEIEEMAKEAARTAGIVAALSMLRLFATGWTALDDAQTDAAAAREKFTEPNLPGAGEAPERPPPALPGEAPVYYGHPSIDEQAFNERLTEIATDMNQDLAERLTAGWGDLDGSSITSLAEINAQSEYSESKSDADASAGWEFAQYKAEATACDICDDCDGVILPSDDPWWGEHEPDNNHPNCKCIKVPLSAEEADARGGVTKDLPDIDSSGWKNVWPPDVSDMPDVLQAIYHSKA
jgi:hypothetical protein